MIVTVPRQEIANGEVLLPSWAREATECEINGHQLVSSNSSPSGFVCRVCHDPCQECVSGLTAKGWIRR